MHIILDNFSAMTFKTCGCKRKIYQNVQCAKKIEKNK